MAIVDEDVAELRERADIVELISGYTQLRKAGHLFKGLCPFHQEKTPSFSVDPGKRLYHCFGCGAGGDVFTFLKEIEGLSFPESAERLASRLGMALHTTTGAPEAGAGGARRRLLEATKMAAGWFAELLTGSPEAAAARRYVQARGFSPEDAQGWGLGYAPAAPDALYRRMLAAKFTPSQIVDAGLAYANDAGEHRDRFRGRLMIPIADLTGDIVGFGARALGDDPPKYLNTRETALYHKSRLLYGLDVAKREMARTGQSVVTEGYTDVIALHKVGVASAVATCGTALGEEHFALIKRWCDRVILAFDSDAAGSFASERGFGIDEKVGLQVMVALWPKGKDPADVALSEGQEAVQALLAAAVPLMQFVLEAELARHKIDTPEGKARALKSLSVLVAREPNRIVRGEYAFWMARQLGVDPRQVQQEISELGHSTPGKTRKENRTPGQVRLEREALAVLLDSPLVIRQVHAWLTEEHFTLPEHKQVYRAVMEAEAAGMHGSVLDRLPDGESRRLAAELALTPLTTEAVDEIFITLHGALLERQIASMRATLDRLDPVADQQEYDSTFTELMRLESQRRRFDDR